MAVVYQCIVKFSFLRLVFGAGCLCVMWSDVIVCFSGVVYDVMYLDEVWSRCDGFVV